MEENNKINLTKNENASDDVKKEIKIEDVNPAEDLQRRVAETVAEPTPAQPVQPQSVVGNGSEDIPTKEEISNRNKTIGMAGMAVAVLAFCLLVGAIFGGGGSYKEPVKNYFESMEKGSGKKLEKAYGDDIVDALDEMFEEAGAYDEDEDVKDIDDAFDALAEENHDDLVEEYGKNIKIKHEIVDKEEMSDKELEKLQKSLKESLDKKCKVKKGYELEVQATVKGKDDKETDITKMKVIKLNGDWVVYDEALFLELLFGF